MLIQHKNQLGLKRFSHVTIFSVNRALSLCFWIEDFEAGDMQVDPSEDLRRRSQGGGMQGHSMSGMNPQQMMAHCAEMRQQMRAGASMSSDMQAMMAHCDQMGGSTGTQRGTRAR